MFIQKEIIIFYLKMNISQLISFVSLVSILSAVDLVCQSNSLELDLRSVSFKQD
jgi:hypothetical protein